MPTIADLNEILRGTIPRGPTASLEYVDLMHVTVKGDLYLSATYRIILWDLAETKEEYQQRLRDEPFSYNQGRRLSATIRDVIEYDVTLFPASMLKDQFPRITQFFKAWEKVVTEVLESYSQVNELRPPDLLNTTPLDRKTFQSVEDFDTALRQKSRLGRYLKLPLLNH